MPLLQRPRRRPLHVGLWDFVWGPNLNVVVDAVGLETNFTLETDRKMCEENSFKPTKSNLSDQSKVEKNIDKVSQFWSVFWGSQIILEHSKNKNMIN